MSVRTNRKSGFTLVELLVVIAIIGVLVALLLPAVQAAREAARRMQCNNHLKQLGLALHNFHDTNKIFPAADDELRTSPGLKSPDLWNASWMAHILPYIEQQALFQQYRFDRHWSDTTTNDAAGGPIKQNIKVFMCPSAPGRSARPKNSDRGNADYAATTERLKPNPFISAAEASAISQADDHFIGVLGHNKLVNINPPVISPANRRMATITDGTSNTFLVAECAGRNTHWWMGKRQSSNMSNGPWAAPAARIQIGGCDPTDVTYPDRSLLASQNSQPGIPGPKAVNCINSKEIFAFHPAGANVVMADGSVRTVSANLDLSLAYALLTRERGETIGEF